MKNCYKKAMSLLLALALVVSIVPAIPAAAAGLPEAAQNAIDAATAREAEVKTAVEDGDFTTCPACGEAAEWTEITAETTAISGHCKVTGDVTVAGLTVAADTCVLLQGNLTSTGATFNVTGGTLNIIGYGYTLTGGNTVITCAGGTVNLFGGTLGGTANKNIVEVSSGIFNMYAGELNGTNPTTGYRHYRCVNVAANATCNVFGGLITRGGANDGSNGGNIQNKGTLRIYGGTISDGKGQHGGNIDGSDASSGKLEIYGGTITGGEATGNGGNIRVRTACTMYGATIKNGTSNSTTAQNGGGNVYSYKELNLYGCTISGGTAKSWGGNLYAYKGTVYVDADTTIGTGSAPSGGGIALGNYDGEGSTKMTSEGILQSSVFACHNNLNSSGSTAYITITGGVVTGGFYDRETATDHPTSTYFTVTGGVFANDPTAYVKDSSLAVYNVTEGYLVGAANGIGVMGKDGSVGVIADVSDFDADAHSYIMLLADTTIADVSGKPVDLNGKTLTVTSGTVTAFDSANDEYEASAGKVVGTTSVEADYVAPNGNRYIALKEDGAYTLHRLNLRLTNATLRAGTNDKNMGLYYKAAVSCDDTLAGKVDAYGVVLSLEDMPGDDFLTAAGDKYTVVENGLEMNEAHTAVTNSGSVFGIMKTTNDDSVNTEHGVMDIYANAYLVVDGKLVLADTENGGTNNGVAYSLYDVLKLIDDNWTKDYTEAQQQTVQDFYSYWNEYGMTWNFTNIGK